MRWTLIVETVGRRGFENMAVDCSLLQSAEEGVGFLRLYRWDPGCLSLGRNEPATRRYDADEIRRRGLEVVRRPTGGRAVWHDAELTYAVAAPIVTFGSLADSYNIIHATIAAGLQALGAQVTLAPRGRGRADPLHKGACFATPVGGEVIAGGKKLVGSAQLCEGHCFLQHGSVLLEDQQSVVAEMTTGNRVQPASTALSDLLDRAPDFDDVAHVIARAARNTWMGSWSEGTVHVASDAAERFRNPSWTWRR